MGAFKQLTSSMLQKESVINQNFELTNPAAIFSMKIYGVNGLTFAFYGGNYINKNGAPIVVDDGTVLLANNIANYVEFNTTTNLVTSNTVGFTSAFIPLYKITTLNNTIPFGGILDKRVLSLNPLNIPYGGNIDGISGYSQVFEIVSNAGLTITIRGGEVRSGVNSFITIPNTTLTLLASSTYYILYDIANGVFTAVTTRPTKTQVFNLYSLTTDATKITVISDQRFSNGLSRGGFTAFTSLEQTITASTNYLVAHGLGLGAAAQAGNWQFDVLVRCKVAEFGYAVGDEVSFTTGPAAGAGISTGWANITNIGCSVGATVKIARRDATFIGVIGELTFASWRIILRIKPIL